MSFTNLRNREITILRLAPVSGRRTSFLTTVTVDYANIQQDQREASLQITGAVGKTYRAYVEVDCDIIDGDRIKDDKGNEFVVSAGGVNSYYDFGGMVQHREVLMVKVTND